MNLMGSSKIFKTCKRIFVHQLLLVFILIFVGCEDDSSLSDVEFDDPSLIKAQITLSKSITDNGFTESIEAYLYDKNDDLINLKNGSVRLNGKKMAKKTTLFGDGKYYSGIETEKHILYPKYYKFDIEFYNGDIYPITIETPYDQFGTIYLNKRQPKSEDLLISWNPFIMEHSIRLNITVYYHEEETHSSKSSEINLSNSASKKGYYKLSRSYYNFNENIDKMKIELSLDTSGGVPKSFMSGSFIKSINSISTNIELY